MKFWQLLSKPLPQVIRDIRQVTLSKYEVEERYPDVCINFYKKGVFLKANEGKVVTEVEYLGVGPDPKYHPFTGEVIPGLRLSFNRAKVQELLGAPLLERQGRGSYDAYIWRNSVMLITYLEDDSQIGALALLDESDVLARRVLSKIWGYK